VFTEVEIEVANKKINSASGLPYASRVNALAVRTNAPLPLQYIPGNKVTPAKS